MQEYHESRSENKIRSISNKTKCALFIHIKLKMHKQQNAGWNIQVERLQRASIVKSIKHVLKPSTHCEKRLTSAALILSSLDT
jgi:hypothetical protein